MLVLAIFDRHTTNINPAVRPGIEGLGGSVSMVVELPNNSYKPITNTAWVRARLCKLQKGCTRLTVASYKVYQLLAHGRWFSLGTPASSTTKTGRHDIAEILLKVALNTKIQIQIRPGIHQTGYRTIKALLHVLSKTTRSHYKYPMFRNLSFE
jgi:hypothetical protein